MIDKQAFAAWEKSVYPERYEPVDRPLANVGVGPDHNPTNTEDVGVPEGGPEPVAEEPVAEPEPVVEPEPAVVEPEAPVAEVEVPAEGV